MYYTSSITCHQNELSQHTILTGDNDSEQNCITSEITSFSQSLLLNCNSSNTSIPIDIPQAQSSSLNTPMANNNLSDLAFQSLSSVDSDSSFSLDSLLMDSYETFDSSAPNEDLVAYFKLLGVNSPARSNLECLSPDMAQNAEHSIISNPSPLFHFGSPYSQEPAQFFINMNLNNLAGSLHSNSTDDDNMQLKLELAEMLPQQNTSQNNFIDGSSPCFSDISQIVPENNDHYLLSPPDEFETLGFPDINLFSQPSSPLPEKELTTKGGNTNPEYYCCSNPPQTPQNLAKDPLINIESFFNTQSNLNFDLVENEWRESALSSCPPPQEPLSQFFNGYFRPMPTIRTSLVTGKLTKIYKCPFCNHTSNRGNNMREHVQIHNPHRPKPFICTICKKSFARKHDMTRHYLSCRKQNEKKVLNSVVPLS